MDPNTHPAMIAMKKELRDAQKEVRTLRRHFVTLNQQLENAESELKAQQTELEQAAERMEKDRLKHKTERDTERQAHSQQLQRLEKEHSQQLAEQKLAAQEKYTQLSQNLQQMEQVRQQEGGNYDKELQDAVEREQFLGRQNAALEYVYIICRMTLCLVLFIVFCICDSVSSARFVQRKIFIIYGCCCV